MCLNRYASSSGRVMEYAAPPHDDEAKRESIARRREGRRRRDDDNDDDDKPSGLESATAHSYDDDERSPLGNGGGGAHQDEAIANDEDERPPLGVVGGGDQQDADDDVGGTQQAPYRRRRGGVKDARINRLDNATRQAMRVTEALGEFSIFVASRGGSRGRRWQGRMHGDDAVLLGHSESKSEIFRMLWGYPLRLGCVDVVGMAIVCGYKRSRSAAQQMPMNNNMQMQGNMQHSRRQLVSGGGRTRRTDDTKLAPRDGHSDENDAMAPRCPETLGRMEILDDVAILYYAMVPSAPPYAKNGLLCVRLDVIAESWVGFGIS
eukprot:CAMPEP_0181098416 /NCGR_PEP_ID=MMETSP1071-20121207/12116_1 /TAXON_ID=35127 /ORGANISM="Thalassiosira sp., Strain NH16" /LENGTH=319 /DNA_ID=CAMNT_0023181013 /DNA_START=735 /DNA_END=1696 /DNA_ORIENTATION=+